MIEKWKDIKGYDGHYQVSNLGNVRHVWKTKTVLLNPFIEKNARNKRYIVHLKQNGKSRKVQIIKLVSEYFIGKCPDGYVPVHINGLQSDNFVGNIKYMSRKDIGKKYGYRSNSRCVAKVDNFGEIVEFYRSARECARHNYMSYQTVIDRCNNKPKSLYAPDGFAYCWDDDKQIEKLIRRIELDNGFMPKANQVEFEF